MLAGVIADAFVIPTAIMVVAASGMVVTLRMYETHRRQTTHDA
jgi:hypothetical protein